MSWEDNSNDESGFRIERKVNGGGWTAVANVGANFLVSRGNAVSSAPGSYQYRVRAEKEGEFSAWSESPVLQKPSGPLDLLVRPADPGDPGDPDDDVPAVEIPEGSGTRMGEPYSRGIPVFNGVPSGYVVTHSSLPAGMSFNETTGVISKNGPTFSLPNTSKVHRIFVGVEFGASERFEQVHFLRVLPAPSTPVVANPLRLPTQHVDLEGFIDISQVFQDPARPFGAWFFTENESIIIALHDTATPVTVGNFLGYLLRGQYDGTYFHRSIPGFIAQGGGYGPASAAATPTQWAEVVKFSNIFNEPGLSNVPGTIAMAKVPGIRDGGSSEWFFNIGVDNPDNLDFQNGGFTAFGSIVGPAGRATAAAIANLVTGDYLIEIAGQAPRLVEDIPVLNVQVAPATLSANSLLRFDATGLTAPVVITLVSNSDETVLDAAVVGPLLYVAAKGPPGSVNLTLRAVNLDGNIVEYVMPITIDDVLIPGLRLLSLRGTRPTGTILVKGSATDTIGLGSWRYRINQKRWVTGGILRGTSMAFSKKIRGFKKGKNAIEFEALDARRNSSGTLRQTFRLK